MHKLQTVTVRTASRMPAGNGFQEVGVSLSFTVEPSEGNIEAIIGNAGAELATAFQELWKIMDSPSDSFGHRR